MTPACATCGHLMTARPDGTYRCCGEWVIGGDPE